MPIARRPRLAISGFPLHILQRGINGVACFYAEGDYLFYLDVLREQARKYDCAIHAYVLMVNHIHLLLTPRNANDASMLMKHLGQRYTQYINHAYQRRGTLWEGRFKSCLIQEQNYVLQIYRYIEMNPLRAGIVVHPGAYPWSSYHANADGKYKPLIAPHEIYMQLGRTVTERQDKYKQLFREGLEANMLEKIRSATNSNYILGSQQFKNEIEKVLLLKKIIEKTNGLKNINISNNHEYKTWLKMKHPHS